VCYGGFCGRGIEVDGWAMGLMKRPRDRELCKRGGGDFGRGVVVLSAGPVGGGGSAVVKQANECSSARTHLKKRAGAPSVAEDVCEFCCGFICHERVFFRCD